MTSGFDEISLALFTTLAPAGVIAFIVLALARIATSNAEVAQRIDRMIALPFATCLLGFIASATHLGTPANALHVFSGFGRSPLSTEVFFAVAFLFLVGSYWMLAFKRRFPDTLAQPWLIVACGAGVALIICTSLAYSVSTVPTWDTSFTPINLWFSALLAGPLLGILFLGLARTHMPRYCVLLVVVSCAALVVGTVALVLHQQSLGEVSNNEMVASELVPHYCLVIALHAALGAAGIGCTACSLKAHCGRVSPLTWRIIGAALTLAAVFITRVAFYQLHLTVGF